MLTPLFPPFLTSLLLAALLTPLAGRLAVRLGRVSPPNPSVDGHTRATPYLGGLAIFCAVSPFLLSAKESAWILGTALMMLVGLLDDLFPFSPARKLLAQAAAAIATVAFGLHFDVSGILLLDAALTVFWLIAIANAFNVTDMMDGLAPGIGGIAGVGFAVVLTGSGPVESATLAAALAGGLFGFLIHNFHPARVFMGDTGSLFAGTLLGCLTVTLQRGGAGVAGFALLGLPLFEAAFLIAVRTRQGRPWYRASRDHTAQRLVQSGLSIRGAVLTLYAAALLCDVVALSILHRPLPIAYLTAGALVGAGLLAGGRLAKVNMGPGGGGQGNQSLLPEP
ncbi:MAG: undecaprenyl/decaprenyl-phosphate alpha-N-acetylglucosaminyl 1-phosphate transferase [Candidatus Latescibacteria bacterium]|nr:undecaprenyl/decaprenyl-phosphate alpha-N-acetylglucosaminyl 1-phosphate transferase [Candidatus Latescibacterota bacterium]